MAWGTTEHFKEEELVFEDDPVMTKCGKGESGEVIVLGQISAHTHWPEFQHVIKNCISSYAQLLATEPLVPDYVCKPMYGLADKKKDAVCYHFEGGVKTVLNLLIESNLNMSTFFHHCHEASVLLRDMRTDHQNGLVTVALNQEIYLSKKKTYKIIVVDSYHNGNDGRARLRSAFDPRFHDDVHPNLSLVAARLIDITWIAIRHQMLLLPGRITEAQKNLLESTMIRPQNQ